MKLSQMKWGKMKLALANMAVPVSIIAKHEAVKDFFGRNGDRTIDVVLWFDFVMNVFPVLFRDCEHETSIVLCCILDKTPEEIDEMSTIDVMNELKSSIDEELISYFRSVF